jgi:hypothetical protein
VDSTEIAPGLGSEDREPSPPAAQPDAEPGPIDESENAEDLGDTPEAAGRSDPAEIGREGAPRPRRRRRRRRRPGSPSAPMPGDGPPPEASSGAPAVAAQPEAEAGDIPGAPPPTSETAGPEAQAEPAGEPGLEGPASPRPLLRLRNRRRRRRPAAPGLLPGHTDPVEGDGPGGTGGGIRAALAPGQRSFSAPRRRRRHAPLAAEPEAASPGSAASGEVGAAADAAPAGTAPRSRNRRRRRPPATVGAAAAAAAGAPEVARDAVGDDRRTGARDRRSEGRGGGPRDRRSRPSERGRGGPPRRVEQKLYSVDAIVDRGFEDVEEDGDTRRVHWTILKRTTADQISRKPVATVYVLQRDGADTEFPNLGTARSAVNKTIVHPEKLTPSKAERAIAKK